MKYRVGSVARVTVPIRALLGRFALILLVMAALGIMLLGKAETIAVERTRVAIIDMVAPVIGALSQPIATLSVGINRVEHFFSVFHENSQLRQQNERLLHWQNAALALEAENTNFRKMLNFSKPISLCFRISPNFKPRNSQIEQSSTNLAKNENFSERQWKGASRQGMDSKEPLNEIEIEIQ